MGGPPTSQRPDAPGVGASARSGPWTHPGAGVLWAGVWLVYLIPAVIEAFDQRHALARQLLGAGLVIGFAGAYLRFMWSSWDRGTVSDALRPWPTPMTSGRWRLVGALIALAIASVLVVGEPAAGTFVFLAPVASSSLAPERALLGIGGAVVGALLAETFASRPPGDRVTGAGIASTAFGTLMAGIITLGVRRMRGMLREVEIARARAQELAGAEERVRIARDLHDLLGHSLTVISVRSQLAQRLAQRGEHARAAEEIAAVSELSRAAMVDVRAAVTGYRARPLAAELAAAEAALQSAGVGVEVLRPSDAVPAGGEEALGFVLREGVTNLLLHSAARRCWITAGRDDGAFIVEIADDGRGLGQPLIAIDPQRGVGASGHGLRGLAERVAAAGGRLSAGDRDGRFVLRAEVIA
ncbi:MAG: histidine kinase [Patulibacter sp.]